jgi:uncharacterized protein YndB with AHSA1/START domain/ketosteroid isomerase-like protein
MTPLRKSKVLSISINAPAERVSDFIRQADNMPKWMTSFVHSVQKSGDKWVANTSAGELEFRFVPPNELGVLDHWVKLPTGAEVCNPMRVVPNRAGSEVTFTLFQLPEMSDERFAEDAGMVERDLRTLKSVLEGSERNSTQLHWHIRAPRENVYRALLDASAVAMWKVPDGMTCQVHAFDPREGGAFRISLTYNEPTATGKTTAHTDTYRGRFVKLVANELVVEVDEFETADPAMQGEMTVTTTLADAGGGTELVAVHAGVPPGISPADNETGWRMALAKLAALVEAGYAEQELTAVAHAWDRAMTENDADAIGHYMADDWTIIGPDGSVSDKVAFLGLVKSGALTHDVMTSEDLNIRVFGDTAVVIARGESGGKYHGQPFREVERVSCVFVRQQGQWRCVSTHLSRLGGMP